MLSKKIVRIFCILLSLAVLITPVFAEEIDTNTVQPIDPNMIVDNNSDAANITNNETTANTNGEQNETGNVIDGNTTTLPNEGTGPNGVITADDVISNATLEEVVSKAEDKISQGTSALQRIIQYACIFFFVVGIGKMLLGSLGHRGGWVGGLIVMLLSAVSYVCVIYAKDIIVWFQTFIIS